MVINALGSPLVKNRTISSTCCVKNAISAILGMMPRLVPVMNFHKAIPLAPQIALTTTIGAVGSHRTTMVATKPRSCMMRISACARPSEIFVTQKPPTNLPRWKVTADETNVAAQP